MPQQYWNKGKQTISSKAFWNQRFIATKKDFICRVSALFVAKATWIVVNIEADPFLLSATAATDSRRLPQNTQWMIQFLSHVRGSRNSPARDGVAVEGQVQWQVKSLIFNRWYLYRYFIFGYYEWYVNVLINRYLADLPMLAFPPNTYDLKHLVSIMLLNKLPFSKFGSTAIFAKCL